MGDSPAGRAMPELESRRSSVSGDAGRGRPDISGGITPGTCVVLAPRRRGESISARNRGDVSEEAAGRPGSAGGDWGRGDTERSATGKVNCSMLGLGLGVRCTTHRRWPTSCASRRCLSGCIRSSSGTRFSAPWGSSSKSASVAASMFNLRATERRMSRHVVYWLTEMVQETFSSSRS